MIRRLCILTIVFTCGFSAVVRTEETAVDSIPPIVKHLPVTSAPAGKPVKLTATVTDNGQIQVVQVFLRPPGASGYQQESMKKIGTEMSAQEVSKEMMPEGKSRQELLIQKGAEIFAYEIPKTMVTKGNIEYYLIAIDDSGNTSERVTGNIQVVPHKLSEDKWVHRGIVGALVTGVAVTLYYILKGGDDEDGVSGPAWPGKVPPPPTK